MTPITGTTFIGFGSKARSGKSLAAETLAIRWPRWVKTYGFGDALKSYCRALHGMSDKDPSLLQDVGQEMRDRKPGFWLEQLHYRIAEDKPDFAVIHDVRHIDEAEYVKSMGGILVRVDRYRGGVQMIAGDRDATHRSECELDDYKWDFIIRNNDGHLAKFTSEVETLFQLEVLNGD